METRDPPQSMIAWVLDLFSFCAEVEASRLKVCTGWVNVLNTGTLKALDKMSGLGGTRRKVHERVCFASLGFKASGLCKAIVG